VENETTEWVTRRRGRRNRQAGERPIEKGSLNDEQKRGLLREKGIGARGDSGAEVKACQRRHESESPFVGPPGGKTFGDKTKIAQPRKKKKERDPMVMDSIEDRGTHKQKIQKKTTPTK